MLFKGLIAPIVQTELCTRSRVIDVGLIYSGYPGAKRAALAIRYFARFWPKLQREFDRISCTAWRSRCASGTLVILKSDTGDHARLLGKTTALFPGSEANQPKVALMPVPTLTKPGDQGVEFLDKSGRRDWL